MCLLVFKVCFIIDHSVTFLALKLHILDDLLVDCGNHVAFYLALRAKIVGLNTRYLAIRALALIAGKSRETSDAITHFANRGLEDSFLCLVAWNCLRLIYQVFGLRHVRRLSLNQA